MRRRLHLSTSGFPHVISCLSFINDNCPGIGAHANSHFHENSYHEVVIQF